MVGYYYYYYYYGILSLRANVITCLIGILKISIEQQYLISVRKTIEQ